MNLAFGGISTLLGSQISKKHIPGVVVEDRFNVTQRFIVKVQPFICKGQYIVSGTVNIAPSVSFLQNYLFKIATIRDQCNKYLMLPGRRREVLL